MLPGPQEHPCSWRSGCGVQGPFGGCGERLPRSSATSLSKGWPPFPWEVLWAKPLPFDSHVSLTIPGLCLTLVPLIGPDPGPHLQADISAWPYPCPQCSPATLDPGWGQWDGSVWEVLPCLLQGSPGCSQHPDAQCGLTADVSNEARVQQVRSRTLVTHVWCTSTLPRREKSWDTTRGLRVSHPTNNIFWISKINHHVPQQFAFLANFWVDSKDRSVSMWLVLIQVYLMPLHTTADRPWRIVQPSVHISKENEKKLKGSQREW